jgi:hypothetical protein
LIERDYLIRVLSAQEDHLATGLPSGPIPMAAPFICIVEIFSSLKLAKYTPIAS